MNHDAAVNGSFNLEPKKPDPFDGKRDYLPDLTWICTIEQYFNLSQLSSAGAPLSDENKITFASS